MDKFQYVIKKTAFESATTIKEKMRIFNEVLDGNTSPYSYMLGIELKSLIRPRDVLIRHCDRLRDQRHVLLGEVGTAKLSQEEIDMVFGNATISVGSIFVENAVKLCNKVPTLRCTGEVRPSSITGKLNHLDYIKRGAVELAMHKGSIPDCRTNRLYQRLTREVVSYDTAVEPLLKLIEALAPLKEN